MVGVDRDGQAAGLAAQGADLVVGDLGELLAAPTDRLHRAGPPEHRLLAAAKRIIAATDDYPADPWRLIERTYNPGYIEQTETLFALSNGFLGIRAPSSSVCPKQPRHLLRRKSIRSPAAGWA